MGRVREKFDMKVYLRKNKKLEFYKINWQNPESTVSEAKWFNINNPGWANAVSVTQGKRKGMVMVQLLPIRQDETIYAPQIDTSDKLGFRLHSIFDFTKQHGAKARFAFYWTTHGINAVAIYKDMNRIK